MGTTDTYKIRYPELGDLADGPDAFRKLAADVDYNMTYMRRWDARQFKAGGGDDGFAVGRGATEKVMTDIAIPIAVIGWCEISLSTTVIDKGSQIGQWAGDLRIVANGQVVHQTRYHNHAMLKSAYARVDAPYALPLSTKSLSIYGEITNDNGSITTVFAYETDFHIRQYGAPRPLV